MKSQEVKENRFESTSSPTADVRGKVSMLSRMLDESEKVRAVSRETVR